MSDPSDPPEETSVGSAADGGTGLREDSEVDGPPGETAVEPGDVGEATVADAAPTTGETAPETGDAGSAGDEAARTADGQDPTTDGQDSAADGQDSAADSRDSAVDQDSAADQSPAADQNSAADQDAAGGCAVPEEGCVAVWCAGDDWCAITCTMELIGNKWHPVIVDRLLARGPLRFNELSGEVGAITNKVLSNSLDDLQEKGLVERTVVNDQPVAVEYALTDYGRSLESVIDAIEEWGSTHLQPANSPDESDW